MPSNDYYDNATHDALPKGATARAEVVDAKFNSITVGLDKLHTPDEQNQGTRNYEVSGGSSGNYTMGLIHVVSSYSDGQQAIFSANHANPGAVTLNVNSIGQAQVVNLDATALVSGDIPINSIVHCRYSTALGKWVLQNNGVATKNAAAASASAASTFASNASTSESNASVSASNTATSEANIVSIVSEAGQFGTLTSSGTDSFEISVPVQPSAYAEGQCYRFIADVRTSGSCTLKVGALVAKNIYIWAASNKFPQSGVIRADAVVEVVYHNSEFVLTSTHDSDSVSSVGVTLEGSTTPGTPTYSGSTFIKWTSSGGIIVIDIYAELTAKTGMAGNILVKSLPFAALGISFISTNSKQLIWAGNTTGLTAGDMVFARVSVDGETIDLYYGSPADGTPALLTDADILNTFRLDMHLTCTMA